jgi:hypothetical protein
MNLFDIEFRADTLSNSYRMFLAALSGRYLALRLPGASVQPAHVNGLQLDAYRFADSFLHAANAQVVKFIADVSKERSQPLYDGLIKRFVDFDGLLRFIVVKNIKDTTRLLTATPPKLLTRDAGQGIGALLQRTLEAPRHTIPDELGRHYEAPYYVQVAARDFFYQSSVDVVADQGELGQVRYMGAHEYNGMVLRLSGDGSYRSLAEVRAEIFHPNAMAILEPYHGSV